MGGHEMKKNYPVMILKKISLMPFQDIRLDLDSEASSSIINLSITKYDANILISCPRNTNEEAPDVRDLPNSAVLSSIKSKIILPNGNIRLVVSGLKRVNITEYFGDEEGLKAKVSDIKNEEISEVDEQTLRRKIISLLKKYIETSSKMSNSIVNLIKGIDSLDRLTDTVIPFLPFNTEKKIKYMQETSAYNRANALVYDLSVELQIAELDLKLDEALTEDFERNQKEFVLRAKLDEIKKELGEADLKDDIEADYLEKINDLKCSNKLKNKLVNEVRKLDYTSEGNPEIGNAPEIHDTQNIHNNEEDAEKAEIGKNIESIQKICYDMISTTEELKARNGMDDDIESRIKSITDEFNKAAALILKNIKK
jgi:ATP-dependent Lon protease